MHKKFYVCWVLFKIKPVEITQYLLTTLTNSKAVLGMFGRHFTGRLWQLHSAGHFRASSALTSVHIYCLKQQKCRFTNPRWWEQINIRVCVVGYDQPWLNATQLYASRSQFLRDYIPNVLIPFSIQAVKFARSIPKFLQVWHSRSSALYTAASGFVAVYISELVRESGTQAASHEY